MPFIEQRSGIDDADALFPVQRRLDGIAFPGPTAPGRGVEINDDAAAAFLPPGCDEYILGYGDRSASAPAATADSAQRL